LLFKKYLTMYASVLSSKIGDDASLNVPKVLSEQDELAVCMIVNTAEYLRSTTVQISETIARIVDDRFKEKVDLKNEADTFSGVTSKGLKALANNMEAKLEHALHTKAKIKWGDVAHVEEHNEYVTQIDVALSGMAAKYREFFSSSHYMYIFDLFVNTFIQRGIIQTLMKFKHINNLGAEQLLLDFTTLKSVLLQLPVSQPGVPAPSRYVRMVNRGMAAAEAYPKLIMTPNDGIVEVFRTLMPAGNEVDLRQILDLKATKREERNEVIQRFHHSQPLSTSLPPTSSPPTSPSFPSFSFSLSSPSPTNSSSNINININNNNNNNNNANPNLSVSTSALSPASSTGSSFSRAKFQKFIPDALFRSPRSESK